MSIINQINQQIVASGGARNTGVTNSGSEIHAESIGIVDGEEYVALSDGVAGYWRGPAKIALERLQALPGGDIDDEESWQRVWDEFEADEYEFMFEEEEVEA